MNLRHIAMITMMMNKTLMIKIKKIREKYDFPIWLIKEALEYYDGDEDATIKKLIEIYYVIGDHPDVVVRRNIEKFMEEVTGNNIKC